jgi:hypothetical protein
VEVLPHKQYHWLCDQGFLGKRGKSKKTPTLKQSAEVPIIPMFSAPDNRYLSVKLN